MRGHRHAARRHAKPLTAVARAQAAHEYASRPPPHEHVIAGARSPTAAVAAFAAAYINWSADTVARVMLALAARSIGQARATAQLAAGETAADYELRRGGIANSGTVEAVARLPGSAWRYVVITRELTTATATTAYEGLAPAWHVALATVSRVAPGEWVVSGWQPET